MCNLYNITKGPQAVLEFTRADAQSGSIGAVQLPFVHVQRATDWTSHSGFGGTQGGVFLLTLGFRALCSEARVCAVDLATDR
jgi:hypothetical protein